MGCSYAVKWLKTCGHPVHQPASWQEQNPALCFKRFWQWGYYRVHLIEAVVMGPRPGPEQGPTKRILSDSPPPCRSLPGACIGQLNQDLEGEGISGDAVLRTRLLVHQVGQRRDEGRGKERIISTPGDVLTLGK